MPDMPRTDRGPNARKAINVLLNEEEKQEIEKALAEGERGARSRSRARVEAARVGVGVGAGAEGEGEEVSTRKPKSTPPARARGVDDRPEVAALFAKLKKALPDLEKLLAEVNDHWCYEDYVYRFYHQSFKVYGIQGATAKMAIALNALRPGPVDGFFAEIVTAGTRKKFEMSHNKRWLKETRPMVEAFFHARFFLEMAVKYGRALKAPPRLLPSGWAALLYFYGLR